MVSLTNHETQSLAMPLGPYSNELLGPASSRVSRKGACVGQGAVQGREVGQGKDSPDIPVSRHASQGGQVRLGLKGLDC